MPWKKVGEEQFLDSGTPGPIAALANGGFVVNWVKPGQMGLAVLSPVNVITQRPGPAGATIITDVTLTGLEDGSYRYSGTFFTFVTFGLERYDTRYATQSRFSEVLVSRYPELTTAGSGFAIVYEYDRTDIRLRIYSAADVSSPEVIVSATSGIPQIAELSAGGFVAAWSSASGIYGRVLTATGGALAANPGAFLIDAEGGAHKLAALAGGGFVATYQQPETSATGSPLDVVARLFDAAGTAVGAEFAIGPVAGDQRLPDVIGLSGGGFAVVWIDTPGGGAERHVRFALFDALGTQIGDVMTVSTSPSALGEPSVTVLTNGSLAVLWNGPGGVYSQVLIESTDPVLSGDTLANNLAGGATNDELNGLGGADQLSGLGGDDSLYGGDGDDVLDGGEGNDRLFGGRGNDELRGGSGTDSMSGGDGNDLIVADNNNENLNGGDGNDVLEGGDGNNQLIGGRGDDTMRGRGGDDVYDVDSASDVLVELIGGGNDTVFTSVSLTLAAGNEIETVTAQQMGSFDTHQLIGNEFDNILTGSSGANVLDGRGGSDVLTGLEGDDTYYVGAGDRVVELANQGNDTLLVSISFALAEDLSIETLRVNGVAASVAIDLTGNSSANRIEGHEGNNFLSGGGGADVLVGFGGADFYLVDSDDVIIDSSAGNRVFATTSYTLGAGVVVDIFSTALHAGTEAINLTGNERANLIFGNAGSNRIDGGAGADTMYGFEGDDFFSVDNAADYVGESAGGGTDRILVLTGLNYTLAAGSHIELLTFDRNFGFGGNLTGNEFANAIYGNSGNNILRGEAGDDTLIGFVGNDTLYGGVGNDRLFGDEGNDILFGEAGNDTLSGSAGDDSLTGADGNDILEGGTGNDILSGDAGNDILYGGTGTNDMIGGTGDDWYFVSSILDRIIDTAGQGSGDRVFTSVSYVLPESAQIEIFSTDLHVGTGAINLTGNGMGNLIYGNDGANTIDGGLGADMMVGRLGDDSYFVDNAGDQVNERAGEGSDRVYASVSFVLTAGSAVEKLSTTLHAGTTAINLAGNELANEVYGNAGSNRLNGGAGKDVIGGFGGADVFVFNTALNTAAGGNYNTLAATANVDYITDFGTDDRFELDDAVFAGMALGVLADAAFRVGATALDADDRILYNSATGALMFDPDGSGGVGALQFALVAPGLTSITASDFTIV